MTIYNLKIRPFIINDKNFYKLKYKFKFYNIL